MGKVLDLAVALALLVVGVLVAMLISLWLIGRYMVVRTSAVDYSGAVSSGLRVEGSSAMQPFGVGAEDDLRDMDVIQPTYLGVQVTQHGKLIQGSL